VDREAVVGEVAGVIHPEAELIELAWVDFTDARKLELPAITTVILDELQDRLAQGFAHELPVPFYYERRRQFVRELL
jgi:hypothetical protein